MHSLLARPILCLVTNSYIVNNNRIVDFVIKAINGGVNMIQMREKHLDFKEQLNLAQKLRAITLNKALLIINNNIDIAMSVKADGIQTGKNGEEIKYIRSRIGSQMLIGYSSHSLNESIQAAKEGANYLIAGSVFKTASHPELHGENTQFLCKIKNKINIPLLAIGGINFTNVKLLQKTKINGIAVMRSILERKNPELAARKLWIIVKKFR